MTDSTLVSLHRPQHRQKESTRGDEDESTINYKPLVVANASSYDSASLLDKVLTCEALNKDQYI